MRKYIFQNDPTFTKRFLIVFLPLAALIVVIIVAIYQIETDNEIEIIKSNDLNHVNLHVDMIYGDFESVVSDLMFLSENNDLQAILERDDAYHYQALSEELLSFSKNKAKYDQIRFLDETGMEIVRINFNEGEPFIVPLDKLQFKGDRYYFKDAFRLDQGEVFVSPLDLNIERGEIEQPLKPMIRFGTPVFNVYGRKRGAVILNYLGAKITQYLERGESNTLSETMLLNSDGFWLQGPNSEDEWGFMYEDRTDLTFEHAFPEAWQQISASESGQFQNADGLYTFATVYPLFEARVSSLSSDQALEPSNALHEDKKYFWKIILFVPSEILKEITRGIGRGLLLMGIGLIIVVMISSYLLTHASIKRERAETALREAYVRNEQLMVAISSILIVVDPDSSITYWNATAEDVFGLSASEVLGKPFFDSEVQWDWSDLSEAIRDCREVNQQVKLDNLQISQNDRENRILEMTLIPLSRESHKKLGVLLLGSDITEHKLMEARLVQTQKLESLGQLAAGIAHEINTPIQFVSNNLRFLDNSFSDLFQLVNAYDHLLAAAQKGKVSSVLVVETETAVLDADREFLSEEIPLAIQGSLNGVERVARIVKAMKQFSHPGGEEKNPTDLNEAIETTISVTHNEWKHVAEMVTDFDRNLPLVPCMLGEFNQVILNLIINATNTISAALGKESSDKGKITVSTIRDSEWVAIRVSDTGPGIPEEIRERVFDPFFTTNEVGKGTGQGLTISYDVVVNKHGGTIGFETEMGKGTTFIVRLPIELNEQDD